MSPGSIKEENSYYDEDFQEIVTNLKKSIDLAVKQVSIKSSNLYSSKEEMTGKNASAEFA